MVSGNDVPNEALADTVDEGHVGISAGEADAVVSVVIAAGGTVDGTARKAGGVVGGLEISCLTLDAEPVGIGGDAVGDGIE